MKKKSLLNQICALICFAAQDLSALVSQEKFECSDVIVRRQTKRFNSLDSLTVNLTQASPPLIMDATDVRGDAPFTLKGFLIRPIYFEALPYNGNCTLVFGWLSTPQSNITEGGVPGAVLLHGGGSTALRKWCEKWAREGKASLAIGLEGQTDEVKYGGWKSTPHPGPKRPPQAYGDYYLQINQQWMFHAVAQTIQATTLLRSQSFVNPDFVGVSGVSWGGVISSTVLSFDYERLAFAISAYGCGDMVDSGGVIDLQMKRSRSEAYYKQVWDPKARLENLLDSGEKIFIPPTLWISWPNESSFPIERQASTYQTLINHGSSVTVSLIKNLGHGHNPSYQRSENYAFVDSLVESRNSKNLGSTDPGESTYRKAKGDPFAVQIDHYTQPEKDGIGDMLSHTVVFRSKIPFVAASKVYACGDIFSAPLFQRLWESTPIQKRFIESHDCSADARECSWSVTVKMPIYNSCAWYVSVTTNTGLEVSSALDIIRKLDV